MDEQQDDVERRLSAALHRMGSEARAPEGLWARIKPRLEDRVMIRGGWSRRFGMATMGVAAALVLAVGGVGTVRVAADLLSESREDDGALLSVSGPTSEPGPDSFAAFDTNDFAAFGAAGDAKESLAMLSAPAAEMEEGHVRTWLVADRCRRA